jgi:hypothetical protein
MKDAKGHGSSSKGGMRATANVFESAFRAAQTAPAPKKKKKSLKAEASSFEKAFRSASKGR